MGTFAVWNGAYEGPGASPELIEQGRQIAAALAAEMAAKNAAILASMDARAEAALTAALSAKAAHTAALAALLRQVEKTPLPESVKPIAVSAAVDRWGDVCAIVQTHQGWVQPSLTKTGWFCAPVEIGGTYGHTLV